MTNMAPINPKHWEVDENFGFSEEVFQMIDEARQRNSDFPSIAKDAEKQLREHPSFDENIDLLVRHAVRALVEEVCARHNERIRESLSSDA